MSMSHSRPKRYLREDRDLLLSDFYLTLFVTSFRPKASGLICTPKSLRNGAGVSSIHRSNPPPSPDFSTFSSIHSDDVRERRTAEMT